MAADFHSFVVLAEMRTGSNFLETNLNALEGVACHGEAFNPHFIGYPNRDSLLGITLEERAQDPKGLLRAIRGQEGILGGFRYFHDHDPRVLDAVLDDPGCAKIILTRNPLDSYVSWKIARSTGQWKLTNIKRRKEALAEFDPEEFSDYVAVLQAFQALVLNRLQTSGQSAFYLAYEDLQDLEVMNGLARWLGLNAQLSALDDSLTRQNPAPALAKVSNPDAMEQALAGLDFFNLHRTPCFEPRRGPAVPGYVTSAPSGDGVPLIYMPIRGALEDPVLTWFDARGTGEEDAPQSGMNQKQLRQWRRKHPQNRSFTVVCHPLLRAHRVYCERILNKGPNCLRQIRNSLRRQFQLPIPEKTPERGEAYDLAAHRAGFAAFLEFLRLNLAGQTAIRVDAAWASQSQVIAGFGELLAPDHILRAESLTRELALVAVNETPAHADAAKAQHAEPYGLEETWSDDIETLCESVYGRDYLAFGYRSWPETAQGEKPGE